MKKILSLLLVGVMVFSMIPAAYATTDYTNGTQVSFNAEADNDGDGQPDSVESYTVTVPAKLAPAGSGDVVAQGTWSSARKLVVTADPDVTLTNSINAADQKVLDVTFPGIELVGSNTAAVTDTKVVSVADIEAALFGTWEGVFEYNVEMVDNVVELISFDIDGTVYQAEEGMTWGEWVESEYNNSQWVKWVIDDENQVNYLLDGEYALGIFDQDGDYTTMKSSDVIKADGHYCEHT